MHVTIKSNKDYKEMSEIIFTKQSHTLFKIGYDAQKDDLLHIYVQTKPNLVIINIL